MSCSERATQDDDRTSVVASFYPLRFAAERLGGACVSVTDLTPPGVEPHDLELTPDAVESIATADVVLYLGGGFQPAIEDAIADAQGETVDLLAVVRDASRRKARKRTRASRSTLTSGSIPAGSRRS